MVEFSEEKSRIGRKENLEQPDTVRITVSAVDPWSVVKIGFLLSVATSLMIIIFTVLVWTLLDVTHVWANIDSVLASVGQSQFTKIMEFVHLDRVLAFSMLIGVLNVIMMTALSAVLAFIYNISAGLIGGFKITLDKG